MAEGLVAEDLGEDKAEGDGSTGSQT